MLALCGVAQAIAQSINVSSSGVDIGATSTGEVGAVVQQSGQDVLFLSKDGVNNPVLNVIVKGDGSVGVGVAEPEEKLEVDGNVVASGSVSAESLALGGETFLTGKSYNSLEQSLPAGGSTLTVAHGLEGVPSLYTVSMRCISTEFGWQVGDEILLGSVHTNAGNVGLTIGVNQTSFIIRRIGNVTIHRRDANQHGHVDAGKWRLVIRAWR